MGAQKQTKKSKSYPLKVSRAVYNNGKIHECVKYMEFVQELKQGFVKEAISTAVRLKVSL